MQPPQPVPPKNYALPVNPVMPASRSRLFISDLRPNDYVYAQLAFAAYDNAPKDLPTDWEVLPDSIVNDTMHWGNQFNPFNGKSGYFGVIFVNYTKRQLVLAIRGTLGSNPGSLTADKEGVVDAIITPQQTKLYAQVRDAVIRAKDMGYHLSITGHSLGAWLAGIATYYCHARFNYNAVSAVVFECPGTLPMVEGPLAIHTTGNQPNLREFDITIYLSLPNRIDTCNPHIGTLFYMQPVESYKSYTKEPHDLAAHHMGGLLDLFKDAQGNLPKRIRMIDWPTMGDELKLFFKEGNINNGFLPNIEKLKDNEQFLLIFEAHFIPDADWNADKFIYLKHFSRELQAFIRNYWQKFSPYLQSGNQNLIRDYLSSLGCSEPLMALLTSFGLDNSGQVLILNQNVIYSVLDFREKLATELQSGGPGTVQRITDNTLNLHAELTKLRAELDRLKIAPPTPKSAPGPSLLKSKGLVKLKIGRQVYANASTPVGTEPKGLENLPEWARSLPVAQAPLIEADSGGEVDIEEQITTPVHFFSTVNSEAKKEREEEKKTLQQTIERPESPGLR